MDTSTISGRVAQVNDKGLKLEGADQWANVSKWAANVVMPTRGQQVTLTLDGRGFIRDVAPLAVPSNGHSAQPAPLPVQPASVAPVAAPTPEAPDWPPPLGRRR